MEEVYLVIQHADGRIYAVLHENFHNMIVTRDGHTYEEIGFLPVAFEDGTPHDPEGLEGEE